MWGVFHKNNITVLLLRVKSYWLDCIERLKIIACQKGFKAGYSIPSLSFPMSPESTETFLYKRAHFSTHLPVACRYTPTHFWLVQEPDGVLRIGFTKFATRMLGEMVDYRFDTSPGTSVAPGQVIGWIEGFKALTELFCVVSGEFAGANPALSEEITLISSDPYGAGWLYRVRGTLDATFLYAEGYRALLDATIDRLRDAEREASK